MDFQLKTYAINIFLSEYMFTTLNIFYRYHALLLRTVILNSLHDWHQSVLDIYYSHSKKKKTCVYFIIGFLQSVYILLPFDYSNDEIVHLRAVKACVPVEI
jgi:hypothetical protein